MTLANAVMTQEARTENGMKAHLGSGKELVDLFYKIGASRGKDIIPDFSAAFSANPYLATRMAAWARDIRGGAGERQIFRDIIKYLDTHNHTDALSALLMAIPTIGRFDDLFSVKTPEGKRIAFTILGNALRAGNGLAAKWTPRKGPIASELQAFFGMTPKQYRKSLVALTDVVENKMCAGDWDSINFSHVPSVASRRYSKAFARNAKEAYEAYANALKSGSTEVKVNADAIFPHDVIASKVNQYYFTKTEDSVLEVMRAQWNALPNYIGNGSIIPIVDVSGSMSSPMISQNVTPMTISVSLGLYCAEKNRGPFKDLIMTFSDKPQFLKLKGDLFEKIEQVKEAPWGMNTDIVAAMKKILSVAKDGNVSQEDMPKTLLIISDMQFDACVEHDDSAMEMINRNFTAAGYKVPQVVFWNVADKGSVPVKANQSGAALVSGYSPSILKSVLSADEAEFTPEGIMMKTIMNPRYNIIDEVL